MSRRVNEPFVSFKFLLELGNLQVAGFSECTGLQMETKVTEFAEGGRNDATLKFPERTSYGNITLKRGMTNSNELVAWHMDIVKGSFTINPRRTNPNVAIILMDEAGNPVKRWNLKRPFPVKWIGPELKAAGNQVAIEALEIAHEGIIQGR